MIIYMESTLVNALLSLTIYHRLKYSYTMIVRHCIIQDQTSYTEKKILKESKNFLLEFI